MYTRKYLINSVLFVCMCAYVRCACVCVCACVREREREVYLYLVYMPFVYTTHACKKKESISDLV